MKFCCDFLPLEAGENLTTSKNWANWTKSSPLEKMRQKERVSETRLTLYELLRFFFCYLMKPFGIFLEALQELNPLLTWTWTWLELAPEMLNLEVICWKWRWANVKKSRWNSKFPCRSWISFSWTWISRDEHECSECWIWFAKCIV